MPKLKAWFGRFFAGRYGADKLSSVILWTCVGLMVISLFVPGTPLQLGLMVAYYGLMGWAIFRCLSRNTYKRYRENRAFLQFWERLRDRKHRYFSCPKCRQSVRVPRCKGKIAITCPRCKEKFIQKT